MHLGSRGEGIGDKVGGVLSDTKERKKSVTWYVEEVFMTLSLKIPECRVLLSLFKI